MERNYPVASNYLELLYGKVMEDFMKSDEWLNRRREIQEEDES